MLVCIAIAFFMSRKRGYSKDLVFDVALICIPLAIIGARAYYIIFDIAKNHNASEWTFKRIIGLEGGLAGLAIYGGLIGGVLGGIIVCCMYRKKSPENRITFIQMLDLFFCVIILGQAIGRWGNFANREAHGGVILNEALQWFPMGVKIDGIWYRATFFYESFFDAIGFALLMFLYNGKRKSFDGFTFSIYCIWYGTVRCVVEGMRTDSLYLGPIRISQLVSALLILLGAAIIAFHIYSAKKANKKIFIFVDESLLSPQYYGYEKSALSRLKRSSEENK